MLKWKGAQQAKPGTYWDIETGERVDLTEQGILPGDASTKYIKASGAVMLLLGPVLGLIYAMFLPLVGIVMTIGLGAKKLAVLARRAGKSVTEDAAKNMVFGWKPVQAYLARKRKGKKSDKNTGGQDGTK